MSGLFSASANTPEIAAYATVGATRPSLLAATLPRLASWMIAPAASAARPIETNIGKAL